MYFFMDIFLLVLAGAFLLVGLLGAVLPVLPGIPLSYLGIVLVHLTGRYEFSNQFLIVWAIIVIVVQLLDNFLPVITTRKFGGSKKGVWGSSIGLIVGLFIGPAGVIAGPFIGAFVGELLAGKQSHLAFKAAFGSFLGLIVGTLGKLIVAGMLIYYYVVTII
jgi:uncharacterized protein